MKHVVLIVLTTLFFQTYAQEGFKGERFIEVTGTAEMEIDPNEITVWIRLREFEENRSKVNLEKLDQDFLAAVRNAGIDRKRLTLADAGSKLSKLGRKDKDAFREKTYELVLNGGPELQRFIEKIETTKVDLVRIVRVHHSEMQKFKIDVKVKALQAARSKAESLTRGIGADIGKPLMIREWEEGPVYPMAQENVLIKARAQDTSDIDSGEEETSFRKIRLRAQVTAQFEIK